MAGARKKTVRRKAAQERRARHATLARQDILAAAAAAFAERGYRGATVQDIAARAGYTPASLYTYFKGKADIFSGLTDQVVDDVEAVFAESPAARASFAEKLEALTGTLFSVTERHHHAVVYLLQLQEQGGYRPGTSRRKTPDLLVNLEQWFEQHASRRDLPALPPHEAAVLYWSLMVGIVRVWAHEEGTGSLLAQAPRLTHVFLYGVQGRPRARR